jgi:superfamily I DNA/RNA helicase
MLQGTSRSVRHKVWQYKHGAELEGNHFPTKIVVLTFTNKRANRLRTRVQQSKRPVDIVEVRD